MSQAGVPRLGATRTEVLHHLRTIGEPSPVADVARALGLHPNTTRFHLDALSRARLVIREVEQRSRPGRPKVLYRAVAGHRSDAYSDLAAAMVRHFAAAVEERGRRALAAGEEWGGRLRSTPALAAAAPLDRVLRTMQALGYEPELGGALGTSVVLRRCPYLEVAHEDPEVVCSLHHGLVRGLLAPGEPWTVTAFQPWATPTSCLVRMGTAEAGRADA